MITNYAKDGRGCGERKRDSIYLCCGVGPSGATIEELVIDPVKVWEHGWQRGFSLIDLGDGVKHVLIFVGKEYYPSPWDFLEEIRRYGVSRNVKNNFPIDKLTLGESQLFFAHRNARPKFDYTVSEHPQVCKYSDDFNNPFEIEGNPGYGYHPISSNPCAFSLQNLAVLHHPEAIKDKGTSQIKIEMPSFEYPVTPPTHINGELFDPDNLPDVEWEIGIFWRCMLTHIEARDYLNPGVTERVVGSGYEVITLDF